jgi:uncharacterized Zn-binding protein involved in type VI secretion
MTRYYIVVGDKTTVGGEVINGSPTQTLHGKERAINTSSIVCPACKSVGKLQVDFRRPDTSSEGEVFALNGDLCICGCNPPPTLLASQSTHRYSSVGGDTVEPMFSSGAVWSASDTVWKDEYDQHFCVCDEVTGDPLINRYYEIVSNGNKITGVTDENGLTAKVSALQPVYAEINIYPEGYK